MDGKRQREKEGKKKRKEINQLIDHEPTLFHNPLLWKLSHSWVDTLPQMGPCPRNVTFWVQNHQPFSLCLLRFTTSMHILTTGVFSFPFWLELLKVHKLFPWGSPQQTFHSRLASYVSRWVWGLPLLPLLASTWEMQSHLNVSRSQLN